MKLAEVTKGDLAELEEVLRSHAQHYPLMQPMDAVKLIYQNEFGGGHLIQDEESCLRYLRREYDSVTKDAAVSLYEPIGNGIVRVNLAAVRETDVEALGQAFLGSAAVHRGDMESFLKKLSVLERVAEEGCFSFDGQALRSYLAEYEAAGYPAVSHSDIYRAAYHPAYRVVCGRREA